MKCEVTVYLQLSTEGSDSLNQESSKILSFFGLSGNTRTLCMFNELRWILWSQTLFNIVINKERNVLKCFFHIVNNIKEKEKGVKLGETTGYFLHYRLFCSPVSQCLSAHICRPLEPFRTKGWLYRKQNPSNSHQRAGQTQRSPKISSGFCVAYEGNRTRTSWISLQYYFLASWNGFWPF